MHHHGLDPQCRRALSITTCNVWLLSACGHPHWVIASSSRSFHRKVGGWSRVETAPVRRQRSTQFRVCWSGLCAVHRIGYSVTVSFHLAGTEGGSHSIALLKAHVYWDSRARSRFHLPGTERLWRHSLLCDKVATTVGKLCDCARVRDLRHSKCPPMLMHLWPIS